jgi:hypothetical protein
MAKKAGLSQTAIVRIWRTFGLQPHRVENFKLSKDRKRLVNSVVICPEVWYSRNSNLGGGSEWLPVMRHQFTQPGDRVTGDA